MRGRAAMLQSFFFQERSSVHRQAKALCIVNVLLELEIRNRVAGIFICFGKEVFGYIKAGKHFDHQERLGQAGPSVKEGSLLKLCLMHCVATKSTVSLPDGWEICLGL